VLWTVPFVAHWIEENKARIAPALPLLASQTIAVASMLDAFAERDQGGWLITRAQLEIISHPVEGEPENYFSWERKRQSQNPEYEPQKRGERDEFLDALYQTGIGKSREEIEFWWITFCKHAQSWILNQEKPVDMYFVKLHNSPYRMNWKQSLLMLFPRIGRVICHLKGDRRDKLVAQSGLDDALVSLDLLAMHKKAGIMYRHVEVEHTHTWWKNTLKVEKERLRVLGPYEYAWDYMCSVRRQLKRSLRIYVSWLAAVARPSARDIASGPAGESRFVPQNWHWLSNPFSKEAMRIPIVVPNNVPDWTSSDPLSSVFAANPGLPNLPDVQPHTQNLRDGGRTSVGRKRK
jgi:hypothetical protein